MSQDDENVTTECLFRRYQAGDKAAFAPVYDRLEEPVRRIVRCILELKPKDPMIDDVCQSVWLAVVRGNAAYQGEAGIKAWIFGIARITCLLAIRDEKTEREGRAAFEAHLRAYPPVVVAPSYDDLDRPDFQRDLERALAVVPPEQREAFELKHKQGLSYEDVARIQNVMLKTAIRRVDRCVLRLRELLPHFGPDFPADHDLASG